MQRITRYLVPVFDEEAHFQSTFEQDNELNGPLSDEQLFQATFEESNEVKGALDEDEIFQTSFEESNVVFEEPADVPRDESGAQ